MYHRDEGGDYYGDEDEEEAEDDLDEFADGNYHWDSPYYDDGGQFYSDP